MSGAGGLPTAVRGLRPPRWFARRGGSPKLGTKAWVGIVIIGIFVLIAIIGPFVAPYDPSYSNPLPSLSLHPPDAQYLLGTTQSGQDVLSEMLYGVRITLEVGLFVGLMATAIAVVVGLSSAVLGGVWDEVLSLVSNIFLVLPVLPLLIVLLGYKAAQGEAAVSVVLAIFGWPWGARVVRAQTLSLRNRDFVAAARETGESTWRLLLFEILPNEVSLIASNFVGTVLYAIGTSVALAFLGLGTSGWSLGTILYWAESQNSLPLGAWWWFVPPGLAVALIGTGLVLLNFGLDELGNPRLREASGKSKIAGRHWRPADPTPVLLTGAPPRRAFAFLHSFSRRSLLEARADEPARRAGSEA
jgi:peptide/nickel transport system permease protein